MVDRAMLQQHRRLAYEHVKLGERHVWRQRELVAELEADGHDTTEAKRLLANFEALLEQHAQERDRLVRKLAALP